MQGVHCAVKGQLVQSLCAAQPGSNALKSQHLFNFYMHPLPGFGDFPETSIFHDNVITSRIEVISVTTLCTQTDIAAQVYIKHCCFFYSDCIYHQDLQANVMAAIKVSCERLGNSWNCQHLPMLMTLACALMDGGDDRSSGEPSA